MLLGEGAGGRGTEETREGISPEPARLVMLAPDTKLGAQFPPAVPEPCREVNKRLKSHLSGTVRNLENPIPEGRSELTLLTQGQQAFSITAE